jgi:hypothetical protein
MALPAVGSSAPAPHAVITVPTVQSFAVGEMNNLQCPSETTATSPPDTSSASPHAGRRSGPAMIPTKRSFRGCGYTWQKTVVVTGGGGRQRVYFLAEISVSRSSESVAQRASRRVQIQAKGSRCRLAAWLHDDEGPSNTGWLVPHAREHGRGIRFCGIIAPEQRKRGGT